MAQYYNYKTKTKYTDLNFTCNKCNWSGAGAQAIEGWDTSSGFPLECPKCNNIIAPGTSTADIIVNGGSQYHR